MPHHPFNFFRPPDLFPRNATNPLLLIPEVSVPVVEEPQPDILPFPTPPCDDSLTKIEAVLFLSREPISERRLSQNAELKDGTRIRALIKNLNQQYDVRHSAFRVVEVAGGFQLRTRPQFASWLVRWQPLPTTVRLNAPALETLAVIAYRQPVHRAEVERIRGVQCGELIRQLLERNLVKIVGRSEELGRPFFYGTTKTFLQVFGLGSLQELPRRELSVPETRSPTTLHDRNESA